MHGAGRGKCLGTRLVGRGEWEERGEEKAGRRLRGERKRERSFRVHYEDMICASHAHSPSHQFCCRYSLCPLVLPTGVTQYTSDVGGVA